MPNPWCRNVALLFVCETPGVCQLSSRLEVRDNDSPKVSLQHLIK